jgi:putative isomerase
MTMPTLNISSPVDASTEILSYLEHAAKGLLRPAAGQLKHPFIVPGAIYGNELWDWDSYWTARGMLELADQLDDDALRKRVLSHGVGCIRNFFEHQSANGAIPIMMRADNPDVFGCLNEAGPEVNQAKPVIGQFALLLSDAMNDVSWFAPLLPHLAHFFQGWEQRYRSPVGLLVWGSDVGIGVDNDPTTWGRPDFSSANLLLNSLYLADLEAAAALAERLGAQVLCAQWKQRAAELSTLIRELCWDSRDRFFYTLDVQCADHRAERIPWAAPGMPMEWHSLPIRIQAFTGFLPLWCGAASRIQAEATLAHLQDDDSFKAPYGVRTLSRAEPMFSLDASCNPSNWLGPIWIMANYFVWQGLLRYGHAEEADQLADKTIRLLAQDIRQSGAIHEYYDPETGRPLMNKGFLSWNLLVLEMIRSRAGR